MQKLIGDYKKSCVAVKKRIKELTEQKTVLMAEGKTELIKSLDLERRIRLLYTEYYQMQEIIQHLQSYLRYQRTKHI